MSHRRLLAVLASAAFLVLPAATHAAAPITVGTGTHPTITVGADGTAHIVFKQGNSVVYCRLPRGAGACAQSTTISSFEAEDIGGLPWVFLNGATISVISNRCCFGGPSHTYLVQSTDGGATFSEPVLIASNEPSGDARIAPDGSVYTVSATTTGGVTFQGGPLAPPQVTDSGNVGKGFEYNGTIGFSGTMPLVAFSSIESGGSSNVAFTTWSGAGSINDPTMWSAPQVVEPGDSTKLAGGPSGLFLMDLVGPVTTRQFQVRKFTGAGFSAPVAVGGPENGSFNDLFQDAGGQVHAVFRSTTDTIRYSVSSNGTSFPTPIDAVKEAPIFNLRESIAPDHKGWVVWDQGDKSGSVRAAPLDFAAGSSTPTGAGPTKSKSVTVGSDLITLRTPKACVAASLTATLAVKSKKRKKKVVVKVKRVDFSIDGKVIKKDKTKPFKQTLKLTGLAPGSKHQIRAKVFLKVKTGPKRSRSIKNNFTVCG